VIPRILRRAHRAARGLLQGLDRAAERLERAQARRRIGGARPGKVNLCCGSQRLPGWLGVDALPGADAIVDLSAGELPFEDASLEAVVCMSAINYFTRRRAAELVREMHRVLRPGGVCRVGVQDMRALAERYVRGDEAFFFQKLPDGRNRFEGPTLGDKFAAWFYGYAAGAHRCEYFYDFESLAWLFRDAGFTVVERRAYRDSRLADARLLDNRPDQMFFLEAVK
jgi:SAM-dependent methyltransferase